VAARRGRAITEDVKRVDRSLEISRRWRGARRARGVLQKRQPLKEPAMKTTTDSFTPITDDQLDTVTGGTLGPEPGVPDPGNDDPCAGKKGIKGAVCRAIRDIKAQQS
jgi:hypothetical protein